MKRGDLWPYSVRKPDKRRPVLVLSRDGVIGLLRTVTVTPITSTIHGAPSHVIVGTAGGLTHDSAVILDHVQTVQMSGLEACIGHLPDATLRDDCNALGIPLGCV